MYSLTFPEAGNTVNVYHVDALDMASKLQEKHQYGISLLSLLFDIYDYFTYDT